MEEAAKEVRTSIDHPQEDERVTASSYTFRIKAPLNAESVDLSLDGGPWRRCRYASGYWSYEWTGYGGGLHQAAARIRPFDSRGYLLRTRRFSVELEPRPAGTAAPSAAKRHVVALPNAQGALARLLTVLGDDDLPFDRVLAVAVGDAATVQLVARDGSGAELARRLRAAGFEAVEREALTLSLGREAENLDELARRLERAGVAVHSLFGAVRGAFLELVLAVDDAEEALRYLASAKL